MLISKGGGDSEFKKGGGSMVQGQVFLKREGGSGTFPILIFQGLSFLNLEITLPLAKLLYAFEEKIFFSATKILQKKIILSCLQMNLKISHELR